MLRGIVICPDRNLRDRLMHVLTDTGGVEITRTLDRYPTTVELIRFLRSCSPQVVFLDVDSLTKALETTREIEKYSDGIQIVAVSPVCDSQMLLELMRAGIREFASAPFDRQVMAESLLRLQDALKAKDGEGETTDEVFAFLPAKAGVGTSTIALNTSIALSHLPETSVLLSDFDLNSGMIRFMLNLENRFCITDATEHASDMDEGLWPQMITTVGKLDVLHAGRLNPDYRIDPAQVRRLVAFMKRNYRVVCFDLSGNLEKYSIEIMHQAKTVFLVCTPEIPSLHLAREKYVYLSQLELGNRVKVLVNRYQKRNLITPEQIQEILGLPVLMTFPNDYRGVHRAMTDGRWMDPSSEIGKQCAFFAKSMIQDQTSSGGTRKKGLLEYLSLVPNRTAAS